MVQLVITAFSIGGRYLLLARKLVCQEIERIEAELKTRWQAFPLSSRDQSFTTLSNQKTRRGLRGLVNGFKVSAVADSGANRNVITAAFAKQRSLKIEGSPATFKLGNSTFVQSLGK